MAIRIPSPSLIRSPNATIHPYPYAIAIQTLEFLQGSIFFSSVMDIASGAYIRLPDGMANLERIFIEKFDARDTFDQGWGILAKYQVVFEKSVYQTVLISMNSHWDWYARRLIDFVIFARRNLNYPELGKSDQNRVTRFSSLPITEQLEVIQIAAGISISVTQEEMVELQEMSLVRNIGLHNRWEIDTRYLERTSRDGYQMGELRTFEVTELHGWHRVFIKIVRMTYLEVAQAFVKAADYP